MSEPKVTVYLVHPKDDPPWVVFTTWEDVQQTIEDGDEGEEWLVKTSEMSESEIEALPEFDGW